MLGFQPKNAQNSILTGDLLHSPPGELTGLHKRGGWI